MCIFFCLSILLCVAPSSTLSYNENSIETVHLVDYCDKIYTLACFKMDAANWIDRFGVNREFIIIPGVKMVASKSVKMQNNDIPWEAARQFPEDADSRTNQYLLRKIVKFLDNYSLNVNLSMVLNDQSEVSARAKDKKIGDTKTVFTSGIMIIAVFTKLALWGLAVLGGKALITSAISLLFSGILGIKELTSKENMQAAPQRISEDSYSAHSRNSNLINPAEVNKAKYKKSM